VQPFGHERSMASRLLHQWLRPSLEELQRLLLVLKPRHGPVESRMRRLRRSQTVRPRVDREDRERSQRRRRFRRSALARRSHLIRRRREGAFSNAVCPFFHASRPPIRPRQRSKGRCCRLSDGSLPRSGVDEASRRGAVRDERASCDLVLRERCPSSRKANSGSPRPGVAAG
jgi:hypothetical protein